MSNDAVLLARQVGYEQRSFWRNPAAAGFTVGFGIMFLVIFNLLFGNAEVVRFGLDVSGSTFYVPAVAAYSVITACYTNIAMNLTFSRDQGVLKRARGAPLPTAVFMGGKILNSTLIALLMVLVVALAGVLIYDVTITTEKIPAFLLTILVGSASFCALGIAITSVVPNADAAPAVVNMSIFPLLFISDIFIPVEEAWVRTLAGFFPIKHFADAMQDAFLPTPGSGFRGDDLLIIASWGIAGAILAARNFSWEPRR